MSEFSVADREFMAQALRLASRGRHTAHPNPCVGCVLVREGRVVGEGWHQRSGAAHAEINALGEAGDKAAGATAYVTLEPCAHTGKTPPCTDALIAAGVVKVIAAIEDPDPRVAGQGMQKLAAHDISTATGLLKQEAGDLNRGFLSRMERGRPFVRLKLATSLDGRTAMATGESQWITGEDARRDVQRLRAASGAIVTGVNTVLADNPSLTVRNGNGAGDDFQPLRVVVDSVLRTPPSAHILSLPGETVIVCIADENRTPLEDRGATVVQVRADDNRTHLGEVLNYLAQRGINDVLVEAGPTLAGRFVQCGLVDELVIYQAPHIMGSESRGMLITPAWLRLEQRLDLEILDIRKTGADLRLTARPANHE